MTLRWLPATTVINRVAAIEPAARTIRCRICQPPPAPRPFPATAGFTCPLTEI